MRFEFATATRIVFGPGALHDLPGIARAFGQRALLVSGKSSARSAGAHERLAAAGLECVRFAIEGEPTVQNARRGAELARAESVELVVACGGGSAMDAGKAIAALASNSGDPFDHLEVVGRGLPLTGASLPFIAIPTTAGTGSEVTRNAVLASPEHGVKASLRSPSMLPAVAIVDPNLLLGLPRAVVAASGLDAFSQLLEPFVSCRANPLVDALCREGLQRSARSLRRAFLGDESEVVRTDLALASLFGGLALANAGLGAVHGFAAPIGGQFAAPHGAVCAALLPAAMRVNVRALAERAPEHPARERYRELATLVTGVREANDEAGIAWVTELVRDLAIPGLSHWGVSAADIDALVPKARAASSMRGNPIELQDEELAEIVRASLE